MIENNSPVIQFLGYRVCDMVYHCTPDVELNNPGISYQFHFLKSNNVLSENEVQENVGIRIFYGADPSFEASRFQLSIEIAGRFRSSDPWQPQWEVNALAILFPYLRSLVSIVTSNSGREPIILPTVNLSSLF